MDQRIIAHFVSTREKVEITLFGTEKEGSLYFDLQETSQGRTINTYIGPSKMAATSKYVARIQDAVLGELLF